MVFSSCVEDEGNNILSDINTIEISGIEDAYYKISGQETLSISPELTGSLGELNESDLEYEWALCNKEIGNKHAHEVIGTERELNYPVTASPSSYTLYFFVKDKSTGLKYEKKTSFNIISTFVKGFYLFGDKEDGTVGLDFISMIEGRDNIVVTDILNNSLNLCEAEDLFFTGFYSPYPHFNNLWAVTKSGSCQIENSSSMTSFNLMEESGNTELFIFPTIPVTKPMKVINVWPNSFGNTNLNRARTARILCTENEVFNGSFYGATEAYGNPINRYSTTSSELFKPSKYVFYKNASNVSYIGLYDETNHRFVRLNSSYSSATYSATLTDTGTPFYFDQTKYESLRSLIYGENGIGNAARSYALMRNTEGNYFIYLFTVNNYLATGTVAHAERSIDLNVATDFSQANHYAFYSMQQILLYAAGTKLYAYDYARNECKLVKDFGAEITHLAMDYNSNNDVNHIIVATYNNTDKGIVYGYTIEDNQNVINVTPVEGEEWHTNLKVVKVEYRNAAN